jgi:hypothetical protein
MKASEKRIRFVFHILKYVNSLASILRDDGKDCAPETGIEFRLGQPFFSHNFTIPQGHSAHPPPSSPLPQ